MEVYNNLKNIFIIISTLRIINTGWRGDTVPLPAAPPHPSFESVEKWQKNKHTGKILNKNNSEVRYLSE